MDIVTPGSKDDLKKHALARALITSQTLLAGFFIILTITSRMIHRHFKPTRD